MQFIVIYCNDLHYIFQCKYVQSAVSCVLHVLIENLSSLQYAWYFAMDACFDFSVVSILKKFKNDITTLLKKCIYSNNKCKCQSSLDPHKTNWNNYGLLSAESTGPATDHMYHKRHYSFPPRKLVNVNEDYCMRTKYPVFTAVH